MATRPRDIAITFEPHEYGLLVVGLHTDVLIERRDILTMMKVIEDILDDEQAKKGGH